MSSPPAKRKKSDHSPTARDIEASNATARFLLGNTHRSWMLNTPNAVFANTIVAAANKPKHRPAAALPIDTASAGTGAGAASSSDPQSVEASGSHASLPKPVASTAAISPATSQTTTAAAAHDTSSTLPRPSGSHERVGLASAACQSRQSLPGQATTPQQLAASESRRSRTTVPSVPPSVPTPVVPSMPSARPASLIRSTGNHYSPQLANTHLQFLPSPAPSEEQVVKSPRQSTAAEGMGRFRMGSMQDPPIFGSEASTTGHRSPQRSTAAEEGRARSRVGSMQNQLPVVPGPETTLTGLGIQSMSGAQSAQTSLFQNHSSPFFQNPAAMLAQPTQPQRVPQLPQHQPHVHQETLPQVIHQEQSRQQHQQQSHRQHQRQQHQHQQQYQHQHQHQHQHHRQQQHQQLYIQRPQELPQQPQQQPLQQLHQQSPQQNSPQNPFFSPTSNPFSIFGAPASARICDFARQCGQTLTRIDNRRLGMLREASVQNDCFFMTLSLLVTSSHSEGYVLPATNPPLDMKGMAIAERLMGADADASLTPQVWSFIQQHPMSLSDVRQALGTINFQQVCNDVSLCLSTLEAFESMVQACREQKILPLSQDLLHRFGMKSVCLQRAAFRAILCRTWGTDVGPYAEQALAHFIKQQHHFLQTKISEAAGPNYQLYQDLYTKHVSAQRAVVAAAAARNAATDFAPNLAHQNPALHMQTRPSISSPAGAMQGLVTSFTPTAQAQGNPQSAGGARPSGVQPQPSLIPSRIEHIRQFANPNPNQLALHQAHLRDPILVASKSAASEAATDAAGEVDIQPRFFRYVSDFALKPQPLSAKPIQNIRFTMSREQLASIPKFEAGMKGSPPVANFDSSSLTFRLKCCKKSSTWALEEAIWEQHLYFNLNGNPLEARRKLQYGKSLPIDVTLYLQENNILTVYANIASNCRLRQDLVVGVEVVAFAKKETLKHDCLATRVRSAKEIRASIVSSLIQTDDEIAITDPTLAISMFEPFTNAKMFDIPVRGAGCVHRSAFDLDVFLETRACEEDPSKVSKIDDWKCPFCGGDARPQSLIVDGFLQEVRTELEAKGLLNTRTILVESDGTYKIKPEIADPDDSEDEDAVGRQEISSKRIEVIEIDSD